MLAPNKIKLLQMGGNKSGIIHNQTNEQLFYTLHSVDKVPQALVTKMSFGVKAGANTTEGVNAGGKGEYTRELKEKFAEKEGICVLPPGRIGQAGLKKLDLETVRHFSLVSETRDILTNVPINNIESLCFVVKPDFSIAYLSANKIRRMKELMKSEELRKGICSKCSRKANQYEFENKFTCTICKGNKESEGWVCQMLPLQHLICNCCHEMDNHRQPQQISQQPQHVQHLHQHQQQWQFEYEGEQEYEGEEYEGEEEEVYNGQEYEQGQEEKQQEREEEEQFDDDEQQE